MFAKLDRVFHSTLLGDWALEDRIAMLVNNAHYTCPVEITALSQFLNKDLGVSFCGFKSQKTTSQFVGKQFRTTHDVKVMTHRVVIIRATAGI
jgi:hypothetical protein